MIDNMNQTGGNTCQISRKYKWISKISHAGQLFFSSIYFLEILFSKFCFSWPAFRLKVFNNHFFHVPACQIALARIIMPYTHEGEGSQLLFCRQHKLTYRTVGEKLKTDMYKAYNKVQLNFITNKAIRDGRPRPPRHQVDWDIVRRECACQISWWSVEKWRRYYILEFRGNTFRWLMTLTVDLKFWKYLSVTEKSYSMCMSSFMMIGWEMAEILHIEISWKHVSVTYDLDRWPKILKIFVSHREVILNVHVKFHDDRLRNGGDITYWNFMETRFGDLWPWPLT